MRVATSAELFDSQHLPTSYDSYTRTNRDISAALFHWTDSDGNMFFKAFYGGTNGNVYDAMVSSYENNADGVLRNENWDTSPLFFDNWRYFQIEIVRSNMTYSAVTPWHYSTSYSDGDQVLLHKSHMATIYTVVNDVSSSTKQIPTRYNTKSVSDPSNVVWLREGVINRHAMFVAGTYERTVGSESYNNDLHKGDPDDSLSQRSGIAVELQNTSYITACDTVAGSGIVADWVDIVVISDGGGTEYQERIDLSVPADSTLSETDVDRPLGSFVRSGIPIPGRSTLYLAFPSEVGDSEVGHVMVGSSELIGSTQFGGDLSIKDFSRKEQDEFGRWSVTEGRYASTLKAVATVDTSEVSRIHEYLASLRATEALWVFDESHPAAAVYGYFRRFRQRIGSKGPRFSDCEIDVVGVAHL